MERDCYSHLRELGEELENRLNEKGDATYTFSLDTSRSDDSAFPQLYRQPKDQSSNGHWLVFNEADYGDIEDTEIETMTLHDFCQDMVSNLEQDMQDDKDYDGILPSKEKLTLLDNLKEVAYESSLDDLKAQTYANRAMDMIVHDQWKDNPNFDACFEHGNKDAVMKNIMEHTAEEYGLAKAILDDDIFDLDDSKAMARAVLAGLKQKKAPMAAKEAPVQKDQMELIREEIKKFSKRMSELGVKKMNIKVQVQGKTLHEPE